MSQSLSELFNKYGTDKEVYHKYAAVYETILEPRRNDVAKVLELGAYEGAGLRAWREYFPRAYVYSLDISVHVSLTNEDRIKCIVGDQTDSSKLNEIGWYGPFDLIVDDASHRIEDQLYSLLYLWQYLKPKGIYVIEDILEPAHLYTLQRMPGAEVHLLDVETNSALAVIRK